MCIDRYICTQDWMVWIKRTRHSFDSADKRDEDGDETNWLPYRVCVRDCTACCTVTYKPSWRGEKITNRCVQSNSAVVTRSSGIYVYGWEGLRHRNSGIRSMYKPRRTLLFAFKKNTSKASASPSQARAKKKIYVYTYNVNNILKIEMVEKEKRIVCFVGKSSNRICLC